jgi:hypothetical protein
LRGNAESGAGLGDGLGAGSVACLTDPMAVAASPDQTTGFGLPVVAVAVSARRIEVAAANTKGATRHGLMRPTVDAYRGNDAGGWIRSKAAFSRH